MNVLVSGQAAIAVRVHEDVFLTYHVDADAPFEVNDSDAIALFAGCTDLQSLNCETEEEILKALESAWAKDRGIHLALLLLDGDISDTVRTSAAECLSGFLLDLDTRDFVQNRLYSAPLPETADSEGATNLARSLDSTHLLEFLTKLNADQEAISDCHAAWMSVPDSTFETLDQRDSFHRAAIDAGAFRLFGSQVGAADQALLQLLVHPYFRGQNTAREALRAWAAPFRAEVETVDFESQVDEGEEPARRPDRKMAPGSSRRAFERALKQKNAVKNQLLAGDRERAREFTEDLVASQRREGEPEHLAKSLCDLATFAKQLGDSELQLEFSARATQEAPDDAWSFGQLGEAERTLGRYDKALDAYQRAGELGEDRVALVGRAEVLKDLGQVQEALAVFDRCIEIYPTDTVARNAKAAALADFGRFGESLELYDELCGSIEIDHVSLTGRATVFRHIGELERAKRELDTVISMYPNELVPAYLRGEVLREFGLFGEALDWFQELTSRFPLSTTPRDGLARVHKESGDLDAALEVYRSICSDFPLDPAGFIGVAAVLRKRGDLADAVAEYRSLLDRFPKSPRVRSGLAATLVATGEYGEAESLLPSQYPASRSDWMAYHIRGMIRMRSGDLDAASQIFERGAASSPWAIVKSFFETSLAVLEVRRERYDRALKLLEKPATVSLEPVAAVVRMHAHGALDHTSELESAYQSALQNARMPLVVDLQNDLLEMFTRPADAVGPIDADQIFRSQCDAILLAA